MIDNGIGIFAGLVESQTTDPYPILHLSYPESVTFKGIRSATRVAVYESVDVCNINAEPKTVVKGVIADISISGARIELSDEIAEIGDVLEIRAAVGIRELQRELVIYGVVRSRVDPADDNQSEEMAVSYGLEFMQQNEEQRLLIYAYVFNQMAVQEHSSE